MNKIFSYNVFDIGQCKLKDYDNSLLSIPKLQRGQVWRPRQIELLWDSLLRNFPIGTLIVLSSDNKQNPPKGEILDGQQRVSAIISGFADVSKDANCVVWVDINAGELNDRKYAIRVTNRAHPWGYHLDGSVYEPKRRRNAISSAGETPGSSKIDWNILNFGPEGENVIPIPLQFFLFADGKIENVIEKCRQLSTIAPIWGKKYLDEVLSTDSAQFERYFSAINRLRGNGPCQFSIPAIVIDTQEDLDLLFSRIGTQGTAITNKELAYALMKSYWDEDNKHFGEVNEQCSKGIVCEEDFAQLVFRLYASDHNIHGEITPEYVRGLRINEGCDNEKTRIREEILNAYFNNGAQLTYMTNCIREWLLPCYGSPDKYHHIIITEIATRKPSLYILLLRLAIIKQQGRLELTPQYIQALSFFMYVCLWND